MTRTLLMVPTGHGSGLTTTCLGVVAALQQRGVDVGFYKPLAQFRERGDVADTSTALIRLISTLEPPEPIPAKQAEQLLSENSLDVLMQQAVEAAEPLLAEHDVVVVEGLASGAGGVYSGRVNLALAKAFDADVVLVSGADVDGDVSRTAGSMSITAQTYRGGEHDRVIGAIVNRVTGSTPQQKAELHHALADVGLRLAGAVPAKEELTWPRTSDLVSGLNVKVLSPGESGRRVKDIIIAAQSVPGMLPLLREGRLVVVPGDRHDVILAVCLAAMNGVRLAGLLLTVGIEPDPRVWELCKPAAATGLPILVTDGYSYETALTLNSFDPEIPSDDRERARMAAATVAASLDPGWMADLPQATHLTRVSPPAFRHRLTMRARAVKKRIVLPEGSEPRTLRAAVMCQQRGIAQCVLLAPEEEVRKQAEGLGLKLPDGLEIIDPTHVDQRYVDKMVEARKHKGMTPERAQDELTDPITLGTMMLRLDEVDGLVAGAVHTTAATVRPALQLLGTAPGAELVSSVFFMCLPDEVVIYGDCAVNPNPTPSQLADIAIQSARSAEAFGIEPRVAMISFSTGSSGSGTDVAAVTEATRIVHERAPELLADGPLQYDAAAISSVARSKAPDSPVAGRATVFVFPDLNTGNTTYKAVQRSADVISIGPMLQGLAKPVNDLSRGALVDDIVYTIALTAIQAAQRDS
ncbi:phosphate acetyltransferase [Kineosporia rhizophila]|uniref:phosphate acetyltransferase n=1 Tax=Kineosporia TaxID=49184 RepID=UPI001E31F1C2|nr:MULTISPECIES: phosphate acetyltransferase [Kineosporia]MCE0533955.1 phosphate acetyltransferase [Kineosporia rhizophila]GLY13494.1 phosphate acetyltransferase [Kineosporia sp. NBRC 101677]